MLILYCTFQNNSCTVEVLFKESVIAEGVLHSIGKHTCNSLVIINLYLV